MALLRKLRLTIKIVEHVWQCCGAAPPLGGAGFYHFDSCGNCSKSKNLKEIHNFLFLIAKNKGIQHLCSNLNLINVDQNSIVVTFWKICHQVEPVLPLQGGSGLSQPRADPALQHFVLFVLGPTRIQYSHIA